MFSKSKRYLLLVSLLSLLLSSGVQAGGLYAGAGLYQSSVDLEGLDDDSDTVPAFFVGYNFWDTVAKVSAELGYYDLGDYSEGGISVDASAVSAVGVAGLGIGPMFEVYGKLGIAQVSADLDSPIISASDDDTETLYGIGASLDILDTIDFYAEYLRIDTDFDADLIGVGVRLDF